MEESSFAAAADASTKGDYIPSEGRQLYSEAEWLQNTVQQKHDVSVLSAYVIRFNTLLSESSITSHVKGLNNVTHVSKLCSMRDNQVLGAILPGWLNLVYSENFGWNSFTTEVLDSLVKECQTHEDTKGCAYMKVTHLQKKDWMPFLDRCLQNSDHPYVLRFCNRVIKILSEMKDDDWYTVLYCGETIQTFMKRMSRKDPRWFLDWIPATHVFRIALLKYSGPWNVQRNLMSGASRALEAINAVWLSNKLPGFDDCHSYNIVHCGHRFWDGISQNTNNHFTYVSYEKIEGTCLFITTDYLTCFFLKSCFFFYCCIKDVLFRLLYTQGLCILVCVVDVL